MLQPSTTHPTRSRTEWAASFYTIGILICIIGTSVFGLYAYAAKQTRQENTVFQNAVKPIHRTTQLQQTIISLPGGKQEYLFSHGASVIGPRPSSIIIDPLTPTTGQQQTVQLKISDIQPIKSVHIIVVTDNTSVEHSLILTNGSEKNGTWEGAWTIDDTYNSTYAMTILATGNREPFNNTMYFRK